MTCFVYRKDESGKIVKEEAYAHDVANLLLRGYKSMPEDFLEGDLNDDGEVTNDEVRLAAKEAGIEKWDTARISTLKGKLGYDD